MAFVDFKSPIFGIASVSVPGKPTACRVLVAGGGGSAKTGISNTVGVFDVKPSTAGKQLAKLTERGSTDTGTDLVTAMSVSPDNSLLACSIGGNCRLYEVIREAKSQRLHHVVDVATDFADDYPTQNVAAFNSDNTRLATGGADGAVRLWRLSFKSSGGRRSVGGKPVADASGPPASSADSVDSDPAVAAGSVATGSTRSGKEVQVSLVQALQGHTRAVHDLATPRTGNMLVSASADGTCRLWNMSSGQGVVLGGLGERLVGNGVVSQGGRRKVTAGRWEYKACVFSADGTVLYTLESSQKGGALLAMWGVLPTAGDADPTPAADTAVKVGSVAAGGALRLLQWMVPSRLPVGTMALSASGTRLALGTRDGAVIVVETGRLRRMSTRQVHLMPVTTICFANKMVISGAPDKKLAVTPVQGSFDVGGGAICFIFLFCLFLGLGCLWLLDQHAALATAL